MSQCRYDLGDLRKAISSGLPIDLRECYADPTDVLKIVDSTDEEQALLFLLKCGLESAALALAVLRYQEHLAETWKYKAIPPMYSTSAYQIYEKSLPDWCKTASNQVLYSLSGIPLFHGFRRIVIGDYGAFVEAAPEQVLRDNMKIKSGEEYRLTEPRYANHVKYIWLIPVKGTETKVYWQRKEVEYADYRPGMYYISPFELTTKNNVKGEKE